SWADRVEFPVVKPRTTLPAAGRDDRGCRRADERRRGEARPRPRRGVLIFCGGIASANASAALFVTTATQGGKRTASPFADGFAAREIAQPAILPLPANAPCPTPIAVDWPEDRHVTDRSPRSYENCPRRFFYTHVLGLGGGRKSTAFSRTHDCLYELIQWLS